ncbi:ATP-binding cassette, subfamily B [Clostridium cavendishii DSM 21758]|uniref:ATP-binding cassette, subfamily B n=1 Tax=Clostridium cavendishii DSM 21758 TaxID=1121302 RepID=A0A1M6IUB3_9CLOT|nr:ABC transporter ATP-binding protein [Clostridium cavendishii]SHJ37994.1 ATP-binding cassette, subfamily B [Clostridium cavendishii DSM 21758]
MFIPPNDKYLIKQLIGLLKPYKKKVLVILVCIIISSIATMIMPMLGKKIMDDGLIGKNFKTVVSTVTLCFLIIIFQQLLELLETKYFAYINSMLPYTLNNKAFKHLMNLKLQYFNNTNFSQTMNNISIDISNVSKIADKGMFYIITEIFKMIGGTIGLLIIDWRLTIIVFLFLPIRYILVKSLSKKRRTSFEEYMKYNEDYSAWYGDTIRGIKEIKLWNLERVQISIFTKKQRNIIKTNIKLLFVDKINEISESIILQIIINALYILGAHLIIQNSITVGELFAFITYSVYVTTPISSILNIGYALSGILPAAKRLFNFLGMETESNLTDCKTINLDATSIKGAITFENVCFSYLKREKTLTNINFTLNKGEKLAIIGHNGSGKSTLLNLLLRFYEPQKGRILLDNMDISKIKLKDFRKLISVVSQDLYLFNTSIKDNITLFSKKNESKMYKAANSSGALDFISELPLKFDTVVGQDGSNLSGGEKQKIAVARAFARDSKIIVFDEATSNFDNESEALLNKLLLTNFKDKTVIIITHKVNILKEMDKILLLHKGRIVDIGTHDELLNRNTLYRDMISINDITRNEDII